MTLPVRNLVPFAHVRDIRASVAFYEQLGFTVHNTVTPPGENVETWAWLECRDAALMLARATEPPVASQQGVLFYFYIEDVAAKHAELAAAGIAVGTITYPFYNKGGEFRVTDPDGYVLMITHT
jgi:predicted enzyme related to lactoylglutathione lyase